MKSQLAAGVRLPKGGKAFLSVRNADKARVIDIARDLDALGFALVATRGTAAALEHAGLKVQPVNKVQEGRPHIVDMLKNREVSFIVNTVEEDRRSDPGFVVHPQHGAAQPHHLLHNACRSARCLPGHAATCRSCVPTTSSPYIAPCP